MEWEFSICICKRKKRKKEKKYQRIGKAVWKKSLVLLGFTAAASEWLCSGSCNNDGINEKFLSFL